jgi:3-oxoacyl-[acyl-carrier-protein] synthase-1
MSANVIGAGACSAVGFDARQTSLGIRARKIVPRPMAILDKHGHRFGSARALGFPEDLYGVQRMVALGARALREAALDAGIAHDKPVRVFLGLAERGRPFTPADEESLAARVFLPELEKASGQRIDGAGSEVIRLGHAGMAIVLERAMAAGGGDPIIVGCVDSYHHPDMIRWLEKELRVLGESIHNGFVPSEGAAFVVLGGGKSDKRPFAKVTHAVGGVEQIPDGQPRLAELMTELVRNGAARIGGHHLQWAITDLNGERHRTKEWSFVTIRNNDVFHGGETREDHMGQLVGDAGAATGALAVVFAATAFRIGFATAQTALFALHSDGDERGVVVMEAAS